jgi:formamidopyrimidine-DNA glycosylase
VGHELQSIVLSSPFLLRTAEPPLASVFGQRVQSVRRLGKRIAFQFENGLWLVVHLMIAGRLHWFARGSRVSGRKSLARFEFDTGVLTLTEAGTQRRASLHLVSAERLKDHERGGLEVLEAGVDEFARRLRAESHTIKRALTDPTVFSGIGNAYSDEILHAARLSPVLLTGKVTDEEVVRLHRATVDILTAWTRKLREQARGEFPEGVTAFRPEFAVHGRYGKPCPVCGTAVQRIRYASNETNYCPRCQTGGKVLADRSLSRLLKADWPRSIEELEERSRR